VNQTIPVYGLVGKVEFYIYAPDGSMRAVENYERDPRNATDEFGNRLLYPLGVKAGLDGVKFSYFKCDGGDVVRFVHLPAGDRRAELFGGTEWWEVVETVEEKLKCSSSPVR